MPIQSGTLMRYAPSAQGPVAMLASCVGRSARMRPLVPPACSSHALSARCGRAQAPAVALPPVAPGADLHDLVAGGAVQSAMALGLLALGHVLATRGWT